MNSHARTDSEDRPQRRGLSPLFWLALLVLGAVAARVATQWNVPLPACGFRRMTSIPCPLCGGTRTMRSIAELDFAAAFSLNPLVTVGFGLVMIWCLLWVLDRLQVTHVLPAIQRHSGNWPAAAILFFLVLLNWAYLIRTLP